jgi:hypothetical protein
MPLFLVKGTANGPNYDSDQPFYMPIRGSDEDDARKRAIASGERVFNVTLDIESIEKAPHDPFAEDDPYA